MEEKIGNYKRTNYSMSWRSLRQITEIARQRAEETGESTNESQVVRDAVAEMYAKLVKEGKIKGDV